MEVSNSATSLSEIPLLKMILTSLDVKLTADETICLFSLCKFSNTYKQELQCICGR